MSTQKYYDKYWTKNETGAGGHVNNTPDWPEEELSKFYESIKGFVGHKILDIGAGEGYFLEYIQKNHPSKFDKISALEISQVAAKSGEIRNPAVSYFVGSADDKYPFTEGEFDTLFMTDVIEHLVDTDEALGECNRVLNKGGKLIIITPVFNLLKKVIIATFFWERFFYPNNAHIRFFTKKSMDSIMDKHGFKRVYYKWGLSWLKLMPQNAYFVYEKK